MFNAKLQSQRSSICTLIPTKLFCSVAILVLVRDLLPHFCILDLSACFLNKTPITATARHLSPWYYPTWSLQKDDERYKNSGIFREIYILFRKGSWAVKSVYGKKKEQKMDKNLFFCLLGQKFFWLQWHPNSFPDRHTYLFRWNWTLWTASLLTVSS